jgi:hypothetical protein
MIHQHLHDTIIGALFSAEVGDLAKCAIRNGQNKLAGGLWLQYTQPGWVLWREDEIVADGPSLLAVLTA